MQLRPRRGRSPMRRGADGAAVTPLATPARPRRTHRSPQMRVPEEARHGHSTPQKQHMQGDDTDTGATGLKTTPKAVPLWQLFKYAAPHVRVCLAVAVFLSALEGLIIPARNVMLGMFADHFATYDAAKSEAFYARLLELVVFGLWIGVASYILTGLNALLWLYSAEWQARHVRQLYFKAALRQNVTWHEQHPSAHTLSALTTNIQAFQEGIGLKVGMSIRSIVTFLAGLGLALHTGWQLAFVVLLAFPIVAAVLGVMWRQSDACHRRVQDSYASAANIAFEVLTGMRTVVTFNTQHREGLRYRACLKGVTQAQELNSVILAIGWGLYNFTMFCAFAVSFYTGGMLLTSGVMTVGDVLHTFTQIAFGCTGLGNMGNYTQAISQASSAAADLFALIDASVDIDPLPPSTNVAGLVHHEDDDDAWAVEFRDVTFAYPSRPSVPVLHHFSLSIKRGDIMAFCAPSGSGKSTIFQLLLRLYDPQDGAIFVNGIDIRNVQPSWLRSHIAIVSQDMVLFDGTIEENLRLGAPDPAAVMHEEIHNACRQASAHDFIMALPQGYQTPISAFASGLSGGQKQRLTIARALLAKPKLLLLDEATSALDSFNAREIEDSLLHFAQYQTTLVISHHRETIMRCPLVAVIENGSVLELGAPKKIFSLAPGKATSLHGNDAAAERNAQDYEDVFEGITRSTPFDTSSQAKTEDGVPKVERGRMTVQRLIGLLRPNLTLILLGQVGSLMEGLVPTAQGVILAGIIAALAEPDPAKQTYPIWCLGLVGLGVWAFIYHLFRFICYTRSAARFVENVRGDMFAAILRQDQEFLDAPENAPGLVCARLASDTQTIERLAGSLPGDFLRAVATVILGLAVVLYSNWRLAFVMLMGLPFIGIATMAQSKALMGFSGALATIYEKPTQLAAQVLLHSRHVTMMGKEQWFVQQYKQALQTPFRHGVQRAIVIASTCGLQDSLLIVVLCAGLLYAGTLVVTNMISNQDILVVMITIVVSAVNMTGVFEHVVLGFGEAWRTLERFYATIDRVPYNIDICKSGSAPPHVRTHVVHVYALPNVTHSCGQQNHQQLAIQLVNVSFAYTQRPGTMALDRVNMTVRPGQYVVIVGPSGSGKSTVLCLLQRLYDPINGQVILNGTPAPTWPLQMLRSRMSVVAQDAGLFNLSIRDNIAYGRSEASMEDVEHAARRAYAHDFISALPEGYNTGVGEKGVMLSGGQRQRLALARALLVDPDVLLLDEATSSLDPESEALVQLALEEERRKGRTVIEVSHRLDKIRHADEIFVFAHGAIVEQGRHAQLILAKSGLYTSMVKHLEMK